MKFLLETILVVIIIFFVWNILKRIFLKSFYRGLYQQNQNSKKKQERTHSKKKKKDMENLNWDAETIDYEEVKEKKNHNKKQ